MFFFFYFFLSKIFQFHQLNNIPVQNGFDTTYLNTEAETKLDNSISTSPTKRRASSSSKRGKRGKGRKRRRRRRNRKRKGNGRSESSSVSNSNLPDITSPSYPSVSKPQSSINYNVRIFHDNLCIYFQLIRIMFN